LERAVPSIADHIENLNHALTAEELGDFLNISAVTIYKHAKVGRIPGCFRIGTCVRFDPKAIAAWLRGRR
jgi:excisionase family DNA binding protein